MKLLWVICCLAFFMLAAKAADHGKKKDKTGGEVAKAVDGHGNPLQRSLQKSNWMPVYHHPPAPRHQTSSHCSDDDEDEEDYEDEDEDEGCDDDDDEDEEDEDDEDEEEEEDEEDYEDEEEEGDEDEDDYEDENKRSKTLTAKSPKKSVGSPKGSYKKPKPASRFKRLRGLRRRRGKARPLRRRG
uniref:Uncharacterized protein n=1 Tax=Stomoxys calcitrans TaxID=35570 RepID=A0A1I8PC46_STOCA